MTWKKFKKRTRKFIRGFLWFGLRARIKQQETRIQSLTYLLEQCENKLGMVERSLLNTTWTPAHSVGGNPESKYERDSREQEARRRVQVEQSPSQVIDQEWRKVEAELMALKILSDPKPDRAIGANAVGGIPDVVE